MQGVTIVDHPLVQHKLALMRAADSSTSKFRQLTREISLLLGYEATRELQVEGREIVTPLERTQASAASRGRTPLPARSKIAKAYCGRRARPPQSLPPVVGTEDAHGDAVLVDVNPEVGQVAMRETGHGRLLLCWDGEPATAPISLLLR